MKVTFLLILIFLLIFVDIIPADTMKFGLGYQYTLTHGVFNPPFSGFTKFKFNSHYLCQFGYEKFFSNNSLEFLLDLEFYYSVIGSDDIDIVSYDEQGNLENFKWEDKLFSLYLPINILYSFNFINNEDVMFYLKAGPAFRFMLVRHQQVTLGSSSRTELVTLFSQSEESMPVDKYAFSFILKPGWDIYIDEWRFVYLQIPFVVIKPDYCSIIDIPYWEYRIGFNLGYGFGI